MPTHFSARTPLPAPRGKFVGRHSDLARIDELISQGERLVTVVGPPGMGKTRLLGEVARAWTTGEAGRRAKKTGAPLWFIDLTLVRTPEEVAASVATMLGVALGGDLRQTVASALARAGRGLVIFDNFEHLVKSAGSVLSGWLDAAPEIQFLVGSRVRTKLEGEVAHELGPLSASIPDAIELFVDRAARAHPGFSLSDADKAAAKEIVMLAGGLPLAIELAAARAHVLSVQDTVSRMKEPLELLRDRTGPAQRSIEDSIRASWDLLAPVEKAALAQCAVFRGGFDAKNAEAVLDFSAFAPSPPVIDVLESLRDQSLLQAGTHPTIPSEVRLDMHLAVREFAARELEAMGARVSAERRHAEHFASYLEALADRSETSGGKEAVYRLDAEFDNAAAAIESVLAQHGNDPTIVELAYRLCNSLERLLLRMRPLAQLGRIFESVYSGTKTPEQPSRPYCDYISRYSRIAMMRGDYDVARRIGEQARALTHDWGFTDLEGRAWTLLGIIANSLGQLESIEKLTRGIELLETGDSKFRVASGHITLAEIALLRGEVDLAQRHGEIGRELYEKVGHPEGMLKALSFLSEVYMLRGEVTLARSVIERAKPLLGDPWLRNVSVRLTAEEAVLELVDGHFDLAEQAFGRALDQSVELGWPAMTAWMEVWRACALRAQDRFDEALAAVARALPVQGTEDNGRVFTAIRAGTIATLGEIDRATRLFETLHSDQPTRGREVVEIERGHVDVARARAALTRGELDLAVSAAQEARARAQLPPKMTAGLVSRAVLLDAIRRLDTEIDAWRKSRGAWAIDVECVAFKTPDGTQVDLSSRAPLRAILSALVAAKRDRPGVSLSWEEVARAAWPGQRLLGRSGKNRVYVAIATLRSFGLEPILLNTPEGYLLDPKVPIEQRTLERVAVPSSPAERRKRR